MPHEEVLFPRRLSSRRAAGRRFHIRVQTELAGLMASLQGIPDEDERRRCATGSIIRLMFRYFVHKRGFPDKDRDYVRSLGSDPVPAAAIDRLLDVFDEYEWSLDSSSPDAVNPGVLGYVFEKHVSRKQLGAYYTAEDVTAYIARNTLIPRILEMIGEEDESALAAVRQTLRVLMQANPDRYIYFAARQGLELPLPPSIAAGLDDLSRRRAWNDLPGDEYGLPGETWREVVGRRRRYEEARAKIAAGALESIDDLVAGNFDIGQLALDLIEDCRDPGLLCALFQAVERVAVLDPTCGPGAFLLAALRILEPLYEACLGRLRALMDESTRGPGWCSPEQLSEMGKVLERVASSPNPGYFIRKSIVENNLFGVDLMAEAVEICRMQLYLSLLARIERSEDLQHLSRLRFNLRVGNALVGFVSRSEAGQARDVSGRSEPGTVSHARRGPPETAAPTEYGHMQPERQLASHKPLHWFVEFGDVLDRGGFDVVIGNPPYVEYANSKQDYSLTGYATGSCGNLYAFVVERSLKLSRPEGRFGFILQLSSISTRTMSPLQEFVRQSASVLHVSCFAERPQQLFPGACIPLAILIGRRKRELAGEEGPCRTFTTGVYRWHGVERSSLFERISYCLHGSHGLDHSSHPEAKGRVTACIAKLGIPLELSIMAKVLQQEPLSTYRAPSPNGNSIYYRTAGGRYWKVMLTFPFETASSANKEASLVPELPAPAAAALLSSNLFWWYYAISFDLYNLKDYMLFDFRFDCHRASSRTMERLALLGHQLMASYRKHARNRIVFIRSKQQHAKYVEYLPRLSKPIIDEIDSVLAGHYDLTDEELDFVVNYDVKYRMGFGSS